jgi:hypothetical protein
MSLGCLDNDGTAGNNFIWTRIFSSLSITISTIEAANACIQMEILSMLLKKLRADGICLLLLLVYAEHLAEPALLGGLCRAYGDGMLGRHVLVPDRRE